MSLAKIEDFEEVANSLDVNKDIFSEAIEKFRNSTFIENPGNNTFLFTL